MSNKDYPGNESFTICLTDFRYFTIRSWYLPTYVALWPKSINHSLVATSKIIVMWAASCISFELQIVYIIRKDRWYVTRKEWKIVNVEVKIIAFVVKLDGKLISNVFDECEIKVACQMIWFVSFLNNQLGWIYLFEMIQNLLVIKNIQIVSH